MCRQNPSNMKLQHQKFWNRKQLPCRIATAAATFFAFSQQSVLPVGKTALCGTDHIANTAILSHEHRACRKPPDSS